MLLYLLGFFLCCTAPLTQAEDSITPVPYQFYGGFSYLSNSFNGVPGSRRALRGWDSAVAFPAWRGLRFKIEVSDFAGNNLSSPQKALSIMAGGQYEWPIHRERIYVDALFGDVGLNRYWGPNRTPGETASFTTLVGGGLDTPLSRHFSVRIQGGLRYTNFALIQSTSWTVPYRIAGLPNFFGSFSSGLVWTLRHDSMKTRGRHGKYGREQVESELILEGMGSFGHFHVFAVSWWSYLYAAGIEYDRHSWGTFLGARMDYSAQILPAVVLRQPSKTDVWGNPRSTAHQSIEGFNVSPIGVRLIWRDGKNWKPYYSIKGGIIGFTQKALSANASYQNFSLQQSTGLQFRLNNRSELRVGVGDFHFSNAFMVPSNPGIDEMVYSAGICYHLRKQQSGM